jgi:hypothetical protein
MIDKKRVSIRDYNATVDHDFPFALGEEVIIDSDGNTGIVEDAIWEGKDAPATHFTITYSVKCASDGTVRELKLAEILALNHERR